MHTETSFDENVCVCVCVCVCVGWVVGYFSSDKQHDR